MLEKIIKALKVQDKFVSGEQLSKSLGITRAALWKKIKTLREKGFRIDAVSAKGYKITKSPEFSIEELNTLITDTIWKEIFFFEDIDSTNTTAMELAEKGFTHGVVVLADSQSKGKGRRGRIWFSPSKSSIYMSVILNPGIEPKDATLLTLLAAIACAQAIRNTTGLDIKIKWPNDITLNGKKLGGILTEIKSDTEKIAFAVIGIGININIAPEKFPVDIKAIATSISEHTGATHSRTLIIAEILKNIERWYNAMAKGEYQTIISGWKKLTSTLGKRVSINANQKTITGFAEDIDNDGALILKLDSGSTAKINSGDLTELG